ncbi:MAG: hypothetical protein AB1736_09295 [Chloroflexota bacterium]
MTRRAVVMDRARSIRLQLERVPPRWGIAPVIGIVGMLIAVVITIWDFLWFQRGTDWAFYVIQARRFLDGGGFYEPFQVAGAYAVESGVANLYPPPALLLFLPFAFLPGPLWWLLSIGSIAAVVVAFRPAPWSWPIIAVLCLAPRSIQIVLWGNTTLWATAFVALGLRFAWPSILVLIKPYFAPLALIGIRHRSWWLAAAAFAVANLVLLPVWADYLVAWRNAGSTWPSLSYSPGDVVMLAIPLVAWLARRTETA